MYIYLNSEDRINDSISQAQLKINRKIDCGELELLSCVFPNTYYNIHNENNNIEIDSIIYTITPGAYELGQLLTELATVTSKSFAYNNITNKITISDGVAFTLNFNINNNIARILGFDAVNYGSSTSFTAIYGPKVYDNFVFLTITNINTGCITSNNVNISFPIPVIGNKGTISQFYDKTHYSMKYLIKEPIHVFNIEFRDESNRLLEGLSDFSIVLHLNSLHNFKK